MIKSTEYELITTASELRDASLKWKGCKELAIDIECENNLHHYGTTISIIQISDLKHNWIVDVIALKNPKELIDAFLDPSIIKIFHDVSFDFRILQETYGVVPVNVFDTSIAAQLLGYKQVGLGPLLEMHFGYIKEKKFQKADWTKRPLTKEMLAYASSDTSYLIELKNKLFSELQAKGRVSWAEEEFKALETVDHSAPYDEENGFFGVKGTGNLSDTELAVFKAIYDEREKIAQKADKPVYFVIRNQMLLELAQNPPKSAHEWRSLKGVHPAVKSNADVFVNAVKFALQNPIVSRPKRDKPKKMSTTQKERFDALDEIRRKIALGLEIEPFLILDRDEMIKIATGSNVSILKKWQQNLLSGKL